MKRCHGHALGDDGTSVVMGHNMLGFDHYIVSCSDRLPRGKAYCVLLNDLLDDRLRNAAPFSARCRGEVAAEGLRPAERAKVMHGFQAI